MKPQSGDRSHRRRTNRTTPVSFSFHLARRASAGFLCAYCLGGVGAPFTPAPQAFEQEIAWHTSVTDNWLGTSAQLLDLGSDGFLRVFGEGRWSEWRNQAWGTLPAWTPSSEAEFTLADASGDVLRVALPWAEVRQILRRGRRIWLTTESNIVECLEGQVRPLPQLNSLRLRQAAVGADGTLWAATDQGLHRLDQSRWNSVTAVDDLGRNWTHGDVLGVAVEPGQSVWIATRAGVGCRTGDSWRFYEGEDGLPYNAFTWVATGKDGTAWFGTRRGAIRFEDAAWHYRQGPRWLPHDDIHQVVVDHEGRAWLATAAGVGCIVRLPMTLAAKAEFYERELERYIKRTPYGYVAEAPLRRPADKTTADPRDSDNDGLWTAMYGAGECFAFAATKDERALRRARQAFEALRFLQQVTQGSSPAPPAGYVARTIRPTDWPDPNVGRLERDREAQKEDRLWKIYEPRWPQSADGQWYWKSDTSSDELDGHFFFYPLYYDFCAQTSEEKTRVQEVVRTLTDHLLAHDYVLIDHDGRPTRWAVFSPPSLNRDRDWWPERGLNSLSMLSYLAVAAHVTGDPRYDAASRDLIDHHGYLQNAMYPKVQNGPGSGNQSDDEMAFMCFYSLLRYSKNPALKDQIRLSFFRYWANEAPELNPFFNFAYAAHNLGAEGTNPWGSFSLSPWNDWLEESLSTLRGFPLDRLNWPHRNDHRLDIVPLRPPAVRDLYENSPGGRGYRVNGRVLPVENRHFNHWNTDPWQLNYAGQGDVLASGTVFLLPYYLGMYHGFLERPSTP